MLESTKKQLTKCNYAKIPNIELINNTDSFIIPQYTEPKFEIGNCYLIKVDKKLICNPNSILATNWNNGYAPQHEYYKAYVNRIMNRMLYCDCLVFDFETGQELNIIFSGWFSLDDIKQIAKF